MGGVDSRAAPSRSRRRESRPRARGPSEPGVEPAERPRSTAGGCSGESAAAARRRARAVHRRAVRDVGAGRRAGGDGGGPLEGELVRPAPTTSSSRTRITVADAPSAPAESRSGRGVASPAHRRFTGAPLFGMDRTGWPSAHGPPCGGSLEFRPGALRDANVGETATCADLGRRPRHLPSTAPAMPIPAPRATRRGPGRPCRPPLWCRHLRR